MESQENNQDKKPAPSGGGFNSYWIYGILFLAIIGINLFYIANPSKDPITFTRFEDMAVKGDISKVQVTNNKNAFVYLKEESLVKEEYKDAAKTTLGSKPHYYFNNLKSTGCL